MRRVITHRVRALLAGAFVATMGFEHAARASLRESAARIVDAFRGAGADVQVVPTRFLNDDETMSVALPARSADVPLAARATPREVDATGDASRADSTSEARAARPLCTWVALLGARGMSFRAHLVGREDDGDEARLQGASVAGALVLSTCAADNSDDPTTMPPRVVVKNEAGRGAVEIIVAVSKAPLPPLTVILPERAGGPPFLQQLTEPGDLPPLAPPASRAQAAEDRARRDGATVEPRRKATSGLDGAGAVTLPLEAGCHRVELFGIDRRSKNGARPSSARGGRSASATLPLSVARSHLDVDAEMRDEKDELLARDRTEAADARLEACVGEPTRSQVIFAGSPSNAEVLFVHAHWPIPERLPRLWDAASRARMASAILARHATLPSASAVPGGSEAVLLAQGASGATSVPLRVEPGACYLAVAAVTHGNARGLGLRSSIGLRDIGDERGVAGSATVVAFCAFDDTAATLHIEARGSAVAWGLAVYRTSGGVWLGVRR